MARYFRIMEPYGWVDESELRRDSLGGLTRFEVGSLESRAAARAAVERIKSTDAPVGYIVDGALLVHERYLTPDGAGELLAALTVLEPSHQSV